MNFASDNWAGTHPEINASIAKYSTDFARPYGQSDLDKEVERQFCDLFEREVAVFYVATGTAANALSMTLVNRPGGLIFSHKLAHMIEDECGAVEYLSGGARFHALDGASGKFNAQALEHAIKLYPTEAVHMGQPMAVSITQASETGTIYSLDEIEAIGNMAKTYDLPLHMDGARFANALVTLNTTPAEMTWKRGVDILSFGGTKNGCWCAEAIVVMDPARSKQLPYLRKRGAQLFSKSRFVSAQFSAYLENDLWLKSARYSNDMALKLAACLSKGKGIRIAWQPQANEVFAIMEDSVAKRLEDAGALFYSWNSEIVPELNIAENEGLYRFVASFATQDEDIDAIAKHLT